MCKPKNHTVFFFEFKEAIQSIKLILSQYHDIDLKSQSAIPWDYTAELIA